MRVKGFWSGTRSTTEWKLKTDNKMDATACRASEQKGDQWSENNLINGGLLITFKQEQESDASDIEDDQNYFEDDVNYPHGQMGEGSCRNNQQLNYQTNSLLNLRIKEEPIDIKTETSLPDVPESQEATHINVKQESDAEWCCGRELVVCDTKKNKDMADRNDCLVYKCNTCQKIFNCKSDLQIHIRTCLDELALKNAVKARFKAKLGLHGFRAPLRLRHLEKEVPKKATPTVHGNCKPLTGKKYSCTLCGASFKCRSNVKVHTALKHSDDRKFECHICQARFKIKYILKKHINIKHSNVRNFSCAQCDAKFKTKFEVISHTRFKHTNERNFECATCGAKFKTKGHLQAHESNTHSKVRGFRCDICSATFKSKTALNRHLKYNSSKLHSNVIVYECKFCSMKFKAELPLKLHMALSHSKNKETF